MITKAINAIKKYISTDDRISDSFNNLYEMGEKNQNDP